MEKRIELIKKSIGIDKKKNRVPKQKRDVIYRWMQEGVKSLEDKLVDKIEHKDSLKDVMNELKLEFVFYDPKKRQQENNYY